MSKEEWLAQREKKLQQERADETAIAQAVKAPPPPLPMTRPKRLGRESDEDDTPPVPSKLKTPARPQDVAVWKSQDFFSAQRDGNPRLTAAVQHLAKHSADKQDTAHLLAKLLESPGTGVAWREMETNPRFAEAVIAALAANGTPVARQTLERLVAGTLPAANPQVAATAALKALLAHDCSENDDLLFRVITAPDRPVKKNRTEIDPQKLRHTAIALMETTASESLRVRLAKEMIAPGTSAALYERLWACLRETTQRWVDFSRSLVGATCRQLRLAAQAEQTTDAQTHLTANAQFPVKLYPNAEVVAVYRLEWPAGLNGRMVAAPSLHVLYVRLEMKARPTRLLAYYRRQLSDCVEHEIYGGRWLDSLIAEKDQAGVHSIDVVLAKASPNALGLPDQEQELTVDILAIECEVVARKNSVSASQ